MTIANAAKDIASGTKAVGRRSCVRSPITWPATKQRNAQRNASHRSEIVISSPSMASAHSR